MSLFKLVIMIFSFNVESLLGVLLFLVIMVLGYWLDTRKAVRKHINGHSNNKVSQ